MVGRDLYLMVDLRGTTSSHDGNYGAAREATREVRFLSSSSHINCFVF